jgi:hypothetical protein
MVTSLWILLDVPSGELLFLLLAASQVSLYCFPLSNILGKSLWVVVDGKCSSTDAQYVTLQKKFSRIQD